MSEMHGGIIPAPAADGVPAGGFRARLAPKSPVSDAVHELLRLAIGQAFANYYAAATGMPEGIHQMRVALRRFRACLSAFNAVIDSKGIVRLKPGIQGLFAALGDVREVDVFLESTLPEIGRAELDPARRSAIEMAARFRRTTAMAALEDRLSGAAAARLLVQLAAWVEDRTWATPAGAVSLRKFARRKLPALHRRMVRARPDDPMDAAGWHEVRILAKKLRYAAEAMLPALDLRRKRARAYARSLAQLQDTLGALNDGRTVTILANRLVGEATGVEMADLTAARGAVARHAGTRSAALCDAADRLLPNCRLPRSLRKG